VTTAILIAGLVVTLVVALAMRRPEWRLAALLFAILAIPGNVDNLMPQMRLDPHPLANSTAPIVSIIDFLLVWGTWLTAREGRFRGLGRLETGVIVGSVAFAIGAALVSMVNVLQGADLAAALRGTIILARIPVLLALGIGLRDAIGDGRRVALGAVAGLVALLGNGLYTSTVSELTRFTAATFGRNGLAVVLVAGAVISTGLAFETWRRSDEARARALAGFSFLLACACLFAAIATGTRISLLVVVPAAMAAFLINRSWRWRTSIRGIGLIVAAALTVAVAATLWTPEGQRALSVITDPGGTVDIITDPEGEPDYSEVRTRTAWWSQAIALARTDPLTGIGAYQWNHRRYELDDEAPPVVADPHNTFIQMGSEYGAIVVAAYVIGLAGLAVAVASSAWRSMAVTSRSWTATAIGAAGFMIPVTELTNSHLFNVRIGAFTWLLIAVTMALSLLPVAASNGRRPTTVPVDARDAARSG
jgi:O-antigen ligase